MSFSMNGKTQYDITEVLKITIKKYNEPARLKLVRDKHLSFKVSFVCKMSRFKSNFKTVTFSFFCIETLNIYVSKNCNLMGPKMSSLNKLSF